jgi:DNA-cytosine methyltransferase
MKTLTISDETYEKIKGQIKEDTKKNKGIKVLSCFDGISIAQQALKELDIPIDTYYSSEIDKYAISITQKNFPNTIQLGDIKDIKGEDFKDIDLIIGGSPCQDLSIAKKNREGLKGSRSVLFYDFVRLVKEIKPKYFILENVNSMPKEAKQVITEELWGIEPVMINAALVSAQNRKRLFWVGKRVDHNYKKVKIEQPKDKNILLKDILESEVDEKYYVKLSDRWNTKRLKEDGIGYNPYSDTPIKDKSRALNTVCGSVTAKNTTTIKVGSLNKGGQGDRVYSPDGKSVNLSANGGGRGAKTGLYLTWGVTSRTRNGKKQIEHNGLEKANAMTSVQTDSMVDVGNVIRKLTPIECERLMTVPDNFTAKGITEKGEVDISNTQRYKTLGNGFNCEVVKHILKTLFLGN